MNWLRKLFASASEGSEDDFLTRDEAREFASRECLRDLIETVSAISYVRYTDDFDDYCRVQINFDDQERGTYTIQLLPLNEREPSEMLDDAKIKDVAVRDRRLNAVRLYRHLHQCSLADAIQKVAELERNNDNVS
ncbi:MAG: hypothetical protein MUC83_16765 [Pirellula sp.]|nr:hypothetical protein [Pirellula sp.]